MSKKYDLLTFEDFFMNFLLELKFLILSHPVTSKQPLKIVQILLVHPVHNNWGFLHFFQAEVVLGQFPLHQHLMVMTTLTSTTKIQSLFLPCLLWSHQARVILYIHH